METSLILEVQAENYKYCVFIRSIACMLQAGCLRVNGDGAHMRQNFEMDLGQATWRHLYAPLGLDICSLICLPNTNVHNELSIRPCQRKIALSFGPFLTLISVECAYGWPAMDTDDELSILCSIQLIMLRIMLSWSSQNVYFHYLCTKSAY